MASAEPVQNPPPEGLQAFLVGVLLFVHALHPARTFCHGFHPLSERSPCSVVFLRAFPQGLMGRERPSQGVLRQCKLRHTPTPDSGSKKGGAPVHLHFPRAGAGVRGSGRNYKQEKEIGEITCVTWKALMR